VPKSGDHTTPSGADPVAPPPELHGGSAPPSGAKDLGGGGDDLAPPPKLNGGGTSPSGTRGLGDDGGTRSPDGSGDRIKDNNPNPDEHTTPSADRSLCGDPIDVATGAVLLAQEDVSLPGALPLVVARTHLSSYRAGRHFGPTWTSTLDERIEVEPDGLHLALADGTLLRYPVPTGMESVLPESGPYLALRRVRHGFLVGDPQSDRTRYFAGDPGQATLPLRAIVDGAGNRIELRYRDGVPVAIEHSGGYRLEIDSADGLVTALRMPGSPVPLAEYSYGSARRLVEVTDAVGTPQKFSYDADGRLVRWEDVNGRWYGYGYDARGRCVRAQGTGGYLDTDWPTTPRTGSPRSPTRSVRSPATTSTSACGSSGGPIRSATRPAPNATGSGVCSPRPTNSATSPAGSTTRSATSSRSPVPTAAAWSSSTTRRAGPPRSPDPTAPCGATSTTGAAASPASSIRPAPRPRTPTTRTPAPSTR
jgi:YD repeat-containing protein